MAPLRGAPSIAVNSSCGVAPWAEVLYFTDTGWYTPRRELVRDWPGIVVTMSKTAKREWPDKVKRVQGLHMPGFPPVGSSAIRQGRSSGQTAISLALALGANEIVLLGLDMRVVDGREHHHNEYSGPRDLDLYAREFVPAFRGWHADALAAGVRVFNATPGSAVTEFPFVDLAEVLP